MTNWDDCVINEGVGLIVPYSYLIPTPSKKGTGEGMGKGEE